MLGSRLGRRGRPGSAVECAGSSRDRHRERPNCCGFEQLRGGWGIHPHVTSFTVNVSQQCD